MNVNNTDIDLCIVLSLIKHIQELIDYHSSEQNSLITILNENCYLYREWLKHYHIV